MNKLIPISLLMLAGCVEFDAGSLIKDTRVLGAKVSVQGDLERSTPHPGETANVEFLIEGVIAAPVVSWSLAVCMPVAADSDPCPDNVLTSALGSGSTPSLQVVVPADSALGNASSLHVSGVICTQDGGCADGEGTPLVYDIALARQDSDENLQPGVQQVAFRFDGKDWPAGEALSQGCSTQSELPQALADEKEHRITIELGPDARELYLGPDMEAVYEELQLSSFITSGELERQFSFVSPDDDRERPSVQIKWTATKKKKLRDAADLGVRMLLVVRDSRGGIAQVERSLCVVR